MELANPERGLLLVMMDVDEDYDQELNRWYDEEHLPERLSCPGILSGRRFRAVEGSPRYLAFYDLESPEVLDTPEYQRIYAPSAWRNRISDHFRITARNVYTDVTKVVPPDFKLEVERP